MMNISEESTPKQPMDETKKGLSMQKRILIAAAAVLLAVIAFLILFFCRRFQVIFDPADGTEPQTVLVTYCHQLAKEVIPDQKAVNDSFLGWFEVKKGEGEQTVTAHEAFDFETRITSNIRLQAVYQTQDAAESFTVTFDTRGGSQLKPMEVKAGEALVLPAAPQKKGSRFKGWETADQKPVEEGFVPKKDLTLFALWEKENEASAAPEKEPSTQMEDREEHITLKLNFSSVHRFGHKTAQAEVSLEHPSGKVEYSLEQLDSDLPQLAEIDPKTGKIQLVIPKKEDRRYAEAWRKGCQLIVRAALPSGQEDMATLILEPDLVVEVVNEREPQHYSVKEGYGLPGYEMEQASVLDADRFELKTNVPVSWAVRPHTTDLTLGNYAGEKAAEPQRFVGSMDFHKADGSGVKTARPIFTIRSGGGQMIDLVLYPEIN